MKPRRIALAVGAAGGGLVAAGFLQTAVALADDYSIVPDESSEVYTALGGVPQIDQTVGGLQGYDFTDLTTPGTGSFDGVSFNDVDTFGLSDQEILVSGSGMGTDVPSDGSLFQTFDYGNGFKALYSDIVNTGGANTITHTLQTPFGNINIPTTFDASAAVAPAVFNDPVNSSIASYSFAPDATSPEKVNSIVGQPNSFQTVSGTQFYDVKEAAGGQAGTFQGAWSDNINSMGQTNQEILVTGGASGVDAPTTGSFFETSNYGSGFENVYTDLAGTGAGGTNTISDTLVTPFGDFNLPTTFDATAALPAAAFAFPSNSTDAAFSYVPDAGSPETITAIDGQAPVNQLVTGTQLYDVNNGTTLVGQFDGVSSTNVSVFGFTNQEIQVTGDVATLPNGLAGADEPTVGSFFDTYSLGSGFENVYSDVVGTGAGGANTITDTFVTPFGDFNIPTDFDATLALPAAEFTTAGSTAAAELAAAMNPADFTGLFAELGTLWSSLF